MSVKYYQLLCTISQTEETNSSTGMNNKHISFFPNLNYILQIFYSLEFAANKNNHG